jgi:polyferredoxin
VKYLKMIMENRGSQTIRRAVQLLFLFIVCFIGFRFSQFAGAFETGMLPSMNRPAGVEAFLPIGALVSLKYFILTGVINQIHPSGLVIFLIICATALVAKKGFCSWICPFGLFSEYLTKLHYQIFKHGVMPPVWLDRILRSVKYLLAGFFIWSIFFKMPLEAIEGFINSPYNILADLKMFRFFTAISMTAFFVIIGLIIFSILIRNFWCRYLCPYGAVIGILSLLSLGKINFSKSHCSDCGRCEKICPGQISIRQGKTSFSLECSACLQCVNTCPEESALQYSFFGNRIIAGSISIGVILIFMFTGGIFLAKKTGNWQNKVSNKTYFYYMMTQGMMDTKKMNAEATNEEKAQRMRQMMEILQNKDN